MSGLMPQDKTNKYQNNMTNVIKDILATRGWTGELSAWKPAMLWHENSDLWQPREEQVQLAPCCAELFGECVQHVWVS